VTEPTWVSWSSGKDSALALAVARTDPTLEVVGLLTTLNRAADRVAMHAVRRELLLAQADAVGLPVHQVELPWPCGNEEYERLMRDAVGQARSVGVTRMVFGDLFLADVRAYREDALSGTGIEPVFPLWGRPTRALAEEMVDRGIRATVTCVDPRQLDPAYAGRSFDRDLLADLPGPVDPCGENGEFHTFVHDGPGFAAPLHVRVGEVVERDGFVFADVLPGSPPDSAAGDPVN
jgi:uncharacterized protein (TIGR00290 family)